MTIEAVTRTIGLVVAPVVMITACSLVLNGLLTRYAAVNDRMRAMAHERFDIIRVVATGKPDRLTLERLLEIDTQVPSLLGRHRLLRNAVVWIYGALALYVASMVIIAAAVLLHSGGAATAALGVFLGGTAILLYGILLAVIEVHRSDRAIHYEMERVLRLEK